MSFPAVRERTGSRRHRRGKRTPAAVWRGAGSRLAEPAAKCGYRALASRRRKGLETANKPVQKAPRGRWEA